MIPCRRSPDREVGSIYDYKKERMCQWRRDTPPPFFFIFPGLKLEIEKPGENPVIMRSYV